MTTRHREQTAFGRRLTRLRERVYLTQEELAERAGLSLASVSAIEQGVRADPRLSTIIKLAAALNVPLGDLVQGCNSIPSHVSLG